MPELKVPSRVGRSDLDRYLRVQGLPINALRLVQLTDPGSWEFALALQTDGRIDLIARTARAIDVRTILDGSIPELLACQAITFRSAEAGYRVLEPIAQLEQGMIGATEIDDRSTETEIVLEGFWDHTLDKRWTNRDSIDRVVRETWFGSLLSRQRHDEMSVDALAHSERIRNFHEAVPADEVYGVPATAPRILVKLDETKRQPNLRHSRLGSLNSWTESGPITRQLKALGPRGLVELVDAPVELGPLGTLVSSEPIDQLMDDIGDGGALHGDLAALGEKVSLLREQREVLALNERIAQARGARAVFFNGKRVGSVPISEYGLVALVHKLEALNAIPLPTYETVAWTTGQGIDGLGRLQLSPNVPVREFAFIEFEYELANFFAHGHAMKQVDLIVLWRVGSRPVTDTEVAWMKTVTDGEAIVPIVVVSELPGLELR